MEICIGTLSRNGSLFVYLDQESLLARLVRMPKNHPLQASVLSARMQFLGNPKLAVHSTAESVHTIFFPDTSSQFIVTPTDDSFTVTISSPSAPIVQADIDLHPASWFGFGHLMHHHWPLDNAALALSPIYPFDNGPTGLSTLLDPTFVSSTGVFLSVDDRSPCLHLAINAPIPITNQLDSPSFEWTTGLGNLHKKILPDYTSHHSPRLLTLQSRSLYDHSHLSHPWSIHMQESKDYNPKTPSLTFSVSAKSNIRDATLFHLSNIRASYGRAPCSSEKIDMMHKPIWSTWAQYKREIDQHKVLEFAEQIHANNLSHSVMGIDDRWSVSYGELQFDPIKFPDPADMVQRLHDLGFMVTLWVTPFAVSGSPSTTNPESRRHYVSMPNGTTGLFDWWAPGKAAALDVTSPEACEWFVSRLIALQDQFGIDGFKFDAGEPCFLAPGSVLHSKLKTPNDYTRAWIHNIASKFSIAEARSAVRGCQSESPMFRIFDRYSTWDLRNGLASVLTAVLTSGILGFPFCIPDYVGGNAYGEEVPNEELMIRWTQVSVAMPALQFSIPPWFFKGEVCTAAVSNALRWREKLFWPKITECLKDASDKLWPIVRPMWWEEPELDGVVSIYDQFMIGKDLLVAPIVNASQTERSVFLPSGAWRRVDLLSCKGTGDKLTGSRWLEKVGADLQDMPVYVRVTGEGLV